MPKLLIPAGGTVRFMVWNYAGDDFMPKLFHIEGSTEWARPVVGLVFGSWWGGSPDPLKPERDKELTTHPLVVSELGQVYEVHDYLETLLGGDHWDYTAHFYEPHVSGPVSNAPRIRYSLVGSRRARIAKKPKPAHLS
ncbi:MAG: hypothetical protein FGM52_05125 [Mycobacterium sp.]|nr:hypothetical protein [Mycobacterium sp.]